MRSDGRSDLTAQLILEAAYKSGKAGRKLTLAGGAGMGKRQIIDVHAHIGRTVANGIGQDTETWLAKMDAAGIGQSIISVAAGGMQAEGGLADTRRASDVIARGCPKAS